MEQRFDLLPAETAQVLLANGVNIHYYCWNPEDAAKPVALLMHGTGFVAATFNLLALQLTARFKVYAYDRRGHGLSDKVENAYQLRDFGEDCLHFCEALGLQDIYGIGHSAGATDLLIAESLQPGLFAKLFVMEPTINDPDVKIMPTENAPENLQARIDQARKRRSRFDTKQQVFELYKAKPLFERWQEPALLAYIDKGFVEAPDGGVILQCDPDTEAQILTDIFLTFSNADVGMVERRPFANLAKIKCDMAVSYSELSGPQFKQLARRTQRHFPKSKSVYFEGLGHCVPQEGPDQLAQEVLRFWANR
jgi:pimeloyl-ACP methyl ester carboxylesterase